MDHPVEYRYGTPLLGSLPVWLLADGSPKKIELGKMLCIAVLPYMVQM